MTILAGLMRGTSPLQELDELTSTIVARESRGFPWSYCTGHLRARLPQMITRVERCYKVDQLVGKQQIPLIRARAMANGIPVEQALPDDMP